MIYVHHVPRHDAADRLSARLGAAAVNPHGAVAAHDDGRSHDGAPSDRR